VLHKFELKWSWPNLMKHLIEMTKENQQMRREMAEMPPLQRDVSFNLHCNIMYNVVSTLSESAVTTEYFRRPTHQTLHLTPFFSAWLPKTFFYLLHLNNAYSRTSSL
jgi:hypothetical protein